MELTDIRTHSGTVIVYCIEDLKKKVAEMQQTIRFDGHLHASDKSGYDVDGALLVEADSHSGNKMVRAAVQCRLSDLASWIDVELPKITNGHFERAFICPLHH